MSSSTTDFLGRPIVAVTGIGVVSSLGQGVEDNWAALIAGRSGIHTITRFSTETLRTKIAGTVDFMDVSPVTGIDLSYALAESAGLEAVRMAGYDAEFQGPLFLAAPPIELEWQHRFLLDRLPGEAREEAGYDRLLELVRQNRDPKMYRQTLFSGISERLADRLGTRGLPVTLSTACASGRERHPARRRGDPPWRDRARRRDRHGRLGRRRSADSLFAALRPLDAERAPGPRL